MRIHEITTKAIMENCSLGAIHIGVANLINNPEKYPGVVKYGSIYDNPRDPKYYNTLDIYGCLPPRNPQQQRGWWRDPYLGPNSWKWEPPQNRATGFRASEKGQGLETQPTAFNKTLINKMLEAYRKGVELKLIDPISPEELTALLLTEGRSDFGFNQADVVNQPKVGAVAAAAMKAGLEDVYANFVAGIYEKQQKAKRLSIPFYQAWQGGKRHVERFNKNLAAVSDPKNDALVAQIKQGMGYVAPTPPELNQAPDPELSQKGPMPPASTLL